MPWYRKFIRIASFLVPSWICEPKMCECLVNSSPNRTESPSVFKYFGCFATIQLWWKTEVRTVSVFYSGAVWKDGATMGLRIVDSENWQWVICLPVVWGQCCRAQLEIPRVLLGSSCYLKGISRAAGGGLSLVQVPGNHLWQGHWKARGGVGEITKVNYCFREARVAWCAGGCKVLAADARQGRGDFFPNSVQRFSLYNDSRVGSGCSQWSPVKSRLHQCKASSCAWKGIAPSASVCWDHVFCRRI